MIGFIIEGVGILIAGLGLHYMVTLINSNGNNTASIYTNLFNTLEAGVVIGGIGVIVIGIGVYLAARQS